jgi:hypothetical protein
MKHDTHGRTPDASAGTPATSETSIARRREILRRIGGATAAAGLASPLAAFAGGSGHPWCYKDKTYTTCVHASISGAASVLLSAQANGTQNYGHSCDYYHNSGSHTHIPTSCQNDNRTFGTIFSCSGSDSNGKHSGQKGCLFDKTITTLLCDSGSTTARSPEGHWASAYCNATRYSSDLSYSTFPYKQSDVCAHYQNVGGIKAQADSFYRNYMENA